MSLEEELSKLFTKIQRARIFADEMNRFGLKKSGKQTSFMHALMEDVEQQYEQLYSIVGRVSIGQMEINKSGLPSRTSEVEPLQ